MVHWQCCSRRWPTYDTGDFPTPVLLVRPHWASTDEFPHVRLSGRAGTQRQAPLTGCCSGWPGRHWPISRRCRVGYRPTGSPVVDSMWELAPSVRCPWLGAARAAPGQHRRNRTYPSVPNPTGEPARPLTNGYSHWPWDRRHRGWGANTQLPLSAPLLTRPWLDSNQLTIRPDETLG